MAVQAHSVFVSGLPVDVDLPEINQYFGRISTVVQTLLLKDNSAILLLEDSSAAEKVIQKSNQRSFRGDKLTVREVTKEEWLFVELLLQPAKATKEVKKETDGMNDQVGKGLQDAQGAPQVQGANGPAPYQGYIPKLPFFSGEDVKPGECSYLQWRTEVQSLIHGSLYPGHILVQAIRRSLRGTAAEVLLHLGEDITHDVVLTKFDTIFGNVLSAIMKKPGWGPFPPD